jgi:dCMP deaminase
MAIEVTRARPSKDETFLHMAMVLSQQSTCVRRMVGCILVNREKRIVGSGYNGNAAGLPHCISVPCAGADKLSGEGLAICEAIHAEQNALMQCNDVRDIWVCYVTTSPCMHCVKMLLNTNCKYIVYYKEYTDFEQVREIWVRSGRNIRQIGG